ncbi:ABC transporter substrate-binding protein [Methanoregula sp.]|uniref:ABC transporter substrate-binding protein n=1 Tax=Methanoregula sp. TaxID=2052170 RepID=UPI003568F8A3
MKKNSSYLLIVLAILVIGMAVIAGCTGSEKSTTTAPSSTQAPATTAAPLTPLNVGYLPNNGHALIFIAKEKGFFEKQGLDVSLFQFQNSAEGTNAILAKKVDVGGFGLTPLVFISKGANETIIGGLDGDAAGLVVTADKADQYRNLTTPADLAIFKGKTIATVRASTGDIHFRDALTKAGLDLKKDITIQELASPSAVLEAVKAGKVDAGLVWTPYMELAESQGLRVVLYTGDFYPRHPCCRIAVLTDELSKNRDTYVRFEKALIESYKWLSENPDASVDVVGKYVSVDKSVLKEAMTNGKTYNSPDPNTKGIDRIHTMMKNMNYINTSVNIDDHIDRTVYKQALDELTRANPADAFYQTQQTVYVTLNE